MRLTNQMKAEIKSIQEYFDGSCHVPVMSCNVNVDVGGSIMPETMTLDKPGYAEKLKTHKIRLENLLCETDLKEQVHFRESSCHF